MQLFLVIIILLLSQKAALGPRAVLIHVLISGSLRHVSDLCKDVF